MAPKKQTAPASTRKRKATSMADNDNVTVATLAAVTKQITADVTSAVLQEMRRNAAPSSSAPVSAAAGSASQLEDANTIATQDQTVETARLSVSSQPVPTSGLEDRNETGAIDQFASSNRINHVITDTFVEPVARPPQLSCRPLYQKVAPKLQQKIWNGEFIEMSQILEELAI